jgi:hypothetical protein
MLISMNQASPMISTAHNSPLRFGGLLKKYLHVTNHQIHGTNLVEEILSHKYGNVLVKQCGRPKEMAMWMMISIIVKGHGMGRSDQMTNH